jgi:hypothetical protein
MGRLRIFFDEGDEGGTGGQSQPPAEKPHMTQFGKEHRHEVLAEHEDLNGVADGYKAARERVAELEGQLKEAVRIPGADATDEERQAFNKARGVPDKPEDYKLQAPEGVEFSEEQLAGYAKFAQRLGLTPQQAQAIVQKDAAMRKAQAQLRMEQAKQVKAQLQEEFGDELDGKLEHLRNVLGHFSGPDAEALTKELVEDGIGNHPHLIRTMFKMASEFGEDGAVLGGGAEGESERPDFDKLYPSMKHLRDKRKGA